LNKIGPSAMRLQIHDNFVSFCHFEGNQLGNNNANPRHEYSGRGHEKHITMEF
jgi:hypothetical protein